MENTNQTREQALRTVNNAIPVLRQINDLYLDANSLGRQFQQLQAVRQERRAVLGKGLGVLAVVAAFKVLDTVFRLLFLNARPGNPLPWLSIVGIVVVLVAVYQKVKTEMTKEPSTVSDRQKRIMDQMDAISKEIYALAQEHADVIEPLPRDYRCYDAAIYFEKTLINGQAESMKEAISLYEEYLHRQKMEANSEVLLRQNEQQSAMLASIERASKDTAFNTGVSAFFG